MVHYYSDVTKKIYETEEALHEAEHEEEEKALEVKKAKEEKAAKAHEVEELYKEANEAYKKANAACNEFIKTYGSWHTTRKDVIPDTKSMVDLLFDSFWL